MTAIASLPLAPRHDAPVRPASGDGASTFSAGLSAATIARAREKAERHVYVIGDFVRPFAGLDGLTSGTLVSGIVKAAGLRPNELHWNEQGDPAVSFATVARHLERIMETHKGAEKRVFVNLGLGADAGLSSRAAGWRELVEAIKRGVAQGITFVVPGGNTSFNPLTSIEGVITAGARETAQAPSRPALFNNPETDARQESRLRVDFRRDGLDFNGDRRADAPLPPGVRTMVGSGLTLFGTEFAAARVLVDMTFGAKYGDDVAPFRSR